MLYVVGTPIGNLDDLSLRQAKTILSSDIILAEDTRSAQTLINYIKNAYKLPTASYKLISYYRDNEFEKLPQVLQWLTDGKKVSLISESGMPLISDPGLLLIKSVIKKNVPFIVVPGPTAVTTALIYSGFNPKHFLFLGFFPKKSSEINSLIKQLIEINKIIPKTVFVFYESPKRINNALQIIGSSLPDADLAVCRELTKKFEQVVHGKAKDIEKQNYRGELVVVMKLQ